jgi:cytochrome c biogenesis protein CcmG/thiol:disulfide interchange protein DsbE
VIKKMLLSRRGALPVATLPVLRRRAALLLALTLAFALPAQTRTAHGAAAVPPAAAGFDLPTTTGTVKLDALRDKVVLVDFWASWCGPCRQSFPWLSAMSERYGKDGLVVVAINLDKDRDAAQAFLREFSPPFTVAFDPAGKSAEAFDVKAMPSSFLVSRTGRLVASHAGFARRDADAFEQQIKEEIGK